MRHKSGTRGSGSEQILRTIKRKTRRQYSAEEKIRIVLENYFLPGDLVLQIEAFIEHYNHNRYHESLKNLTPADVCFGRGQAILNQPERIKQKTIETRRLQYRKTAA